MGHPASALRAAIAAADAIATRAGEEIRGARRNGLITKAECVGGCDLRAGTVS
jgi:hypothetical protein